MMSRVQSLEQVYILNKLDVDKISISGQALDELERLEAISFNRNLTPWFPTFRTSGEMRNFSLLI